MNCYLSTTFDRAHRPTTAVLRELRQQGVLAVELGSTHAPEPHLETMLRDEFGDLSLITHNFFPPPTDPSLVINFSDPRPEERSRSVQLTSDNVRFASRISSRLHTVHPGFLAAARPGGAQDRSYDFRLNPLAASSPEQAFGWMVDGLAPVAREAAALRVPLAVETQGSVDNRDFCLLQTSEEVLALCRAIPARAVGISVNLGHLNLAAEAWDFDRLRFLDDIADHIVAFELSHNDGRYDSHLPLHPDGWYWDVIGDSRFRDLPMILELREVETREACRHYSVLVNRRARAGVAR